MTQCDILLVEDDEGIREPLKDLLQGVGYNVTASRNGRQALELLDEMPTKPKLILLDLMMPQMSGTEFLAAVRRRNDLKNVAVIVMTAWVHRFPEIAGKADEIVRKPLDTDHLLSLVRRYCGDAGAGAAPGTEPDPPTAPRSRPKRRPRGSLAYGERPWMGRVMRRTIRSRG